MKRSEMVDKISKLLYRGNGNYLNRNNAIYDAKDILDLLEEYGIMMTTVEKLGNGLDIRQISYWEDEQQYGKSIVDQLNEDIKALNGLKSVTIILDDAKDVDWDKLTLL